MEKKLKEQIVKSAKAVKRKVEMIKNIKNANNMTLETIFKPITDPLQQIANSTNVEYIEPLRNKNKVGTKSNTSCSPMEDFEESNTEDESDSDIETEIKSEKTLTKSLSDLEENNITSESSFMSSKSSPSASKDQSLSGSLSSEVLKDTPFGVKNTQGKLMLGKTLVFVDDNSNILRIGNRTLKKTSGLVELLFKKVPQLDIITDEDLQNYKLLLMDTNAHKRNCDPTKPITSNKGFKYMHIIKPLFKFTENKTTSAKRVSKGKGIEILKKVKNDTDFIYWDDPNELVERLQLLFASRDAGNTGVDNEIIAIIEELYEAGVVDNNIRDLQIKNLNSWYTANIV